MNAIVPTSDNIATLMEQVMIEGDLSKLTPRDRITYYGEVCRSAGLNPLTKPFAYLTLNGKMQLYALKACTDQLRYVHGISVEEMTNKTVEGVYVVTAKVRNAAGRADVDDGAVNIGGLKGENLANAMMKAATKAKRRATLSICGLGMLDESEVETIPGAVRGEPQAQQSPPSPPSPPPAHDPKTGEVGPRGLPVPTKGGKENWVAWGKDLIGAVMASQSHEDIDAWRNANAKTLERCEKDGPKAHASIMKAVSQRSNELMEGPKGDAAPKSASAYEDWKRDIEAELDACTSEEAVDDLMERALPEMFPGDKDAFKERCAEKRTALFNR